METVKVRCEEEFSDREFYKENPLKTDKIAFNIYDFEPWQALPMRRHLHSDTILLVVEGEGTMFMDDDEFSLTPGEAVYVPAGARYGILAGDNDMVVTSSQGPKPIETELDQVLEYRCPACDLQTPVTRDTVDNAETACPRCNACLRLKKEGDRFKAEEVSPPQLTGVASCEPAEKGQELSEAASDVAEMVGPGKPEPGASEAEKPGEEQGVAEAAPVEVEIEQIEVEGPGEEEGTAKPLPVEVEVEQAEAEPAKIAFSLYEFGPWQVLPMHMNPESDTILYVASGQGIVFLNDEERSVDADTAVYVPARATYGMIAGDYDMAVVAIQCPVPVEPQVFENLGYNCPVCDLGTPVTTNTFTGCVTVCPRCNVKLKLTKGEEGFEAEETSEPAPASAETI